MGLVLERGCVRQSQPEIMRLSLAGGPQSGLNTASPGGAFRARESSSGRTADADLDRRDMMRRPQAG